MTMVTRTIPAGEFKAKCLQLLDEVQRTGGMIIVTKRGKPVARLTAPPAEHTESVFGRQKGSVTILGDIVHTDDVYAEGIREMEEEWDGLYGRK
jgi:prevent-host-death family protein